MNFKQLLVIAFVGILSGAAGSFLAVMLLADSLKGPTGSRGEAGPTGPPGPAASNEQLVTLVSEWLDGTAVIQDRKGWGLSTCPTGAYEDRFAALSFPDESGVIQTVSLCRFGDALVP